MMATDIVNPTAASGTGPRGASIRLSVTPSRVEAASPTTIGTARLKSPGTSASTMPRTGA